jgi:hypothetical protein
VVLPGEEVGGREDMIQIVARWFQARADLVGLRPVRITTVVVRVAFDGHFDAIVVVRVSFGPVQRLEILGADLVKDPFHRPVGVLVDVGKADAFRQVATHRLLVEQQPESSQHGSPARGEAHAFPFHDGGIAVRTVREILHSGNASLANRGGSDHDNVRVAENNATPPGNAIAPGPTGPLVWALRRRHWL